MPEAVFIFTFSPVQPFISESRRTADLHNASQILVRLANSVSEVLGGEPGCSLIYPAEQTEDTPNKLVARLPWDKVDDIAVKSKAAFLAAWQKMVVVAKDKIPSTNDPTLRYIWDYQTKSEYYWETYWAAAKIENDSYRDAYDKATRALDSVKRQRGFHPTLEEGLKDTLSGARSALRTQADDAREYWDMVAKRRGNVHVKRGERLDALGVIKRFLSLAGESFPSTSTIASLDYINRVVNHPSGSDLLQDYNNALIRLGVTEVRKGEDWPFDGDLLYIDSLVQVLKDDHGCKEDEIAKEKPEVQLSKIYKACGKPSPYYAILVLDGDNMGTRINEALGEPDPVMAHKVFSLKLGDFSQMVRGIVERQEVNIYPPAEPVKVTETENLTHFGKVVYNGGDDVLAFSPLSTALPMAQELAKVFKDKTGCTASAGIAIIHHGSPLSAALRAARHAEQAAKQVDGKAAVCVRVLKRSGAPFAVRSHWDDLAENFKDMVALFTDTGGTKSRLALGFAHDLSKSADTLSEVDALFKAELKLLLSCHRNPKHPLPLEVVSWTDRLFIWGGTLPEKAKELGYWAILARFIAQGGEE